MDFYKKIMYKETSVAVLGLGYVGLPLATAIMLKGFITIGIDIDPERIKYLKINLAGKKPPFENCNVIKLELTTDFSLLQQSNVAIICVPTPIHADLTPDISLVQAAALEVARHITGPTLVIVESTIPPGALRENVFPLFAAQGLLHDQDFYLAYAPERIDPGNKQYGIKNTPRVVGGMSKAACRLACNFYAHLVDKVIDVTSPEVAETVKLLENSFRCLNIAFINEVETYCLEQGINIFEVINAAATKPFGFMPFFPGPGVGGHCLTTDPYFLTWKARLQQTPCRLLELAASLNQERPRQIFHKIAEALRKAGKKLAGERILLIGITYKKNVPDLRESPAIKLFQILMEHHVLVSFYDPLVFQVELAGNKYAGEPRLDEELLKKTDCAVITTDHDGIDYEKIRQSVPLLIDTKGVTF